MKTTEQPAFSECVFLFDVDNTLLDNDRVTLDLMRHLEKEVGPEGAKRYWDIFDQLRIELGYADYLGALQRYRNENPHELRLFTLSRFLINYPFKERLFPLALEVLERAKQLGTVAILSDGDVVFQPRKVEQSGLSDAVDGNVLIYAHKEWELADITTRFPSAHYVLVDDKLRILEVIKKSWGSQVTTVFVRQGHYADNPLNSANYLPADLSIIRIGDLVTCGLDDLCPRFTTVTSNGQAKTKRLP